MDKDNDKVLGLDSLDFMKDNGNEFFLTTEDKATYDELEKVNPTLKEFTFEDLEIEVIDELDDEIKIILAEYEKDLELWQESRRLEDGKLGPFKKR